MTILEPIDAYPTQRIAGYPVRAGRSLPFGATRVPGGVNFSVYSNHATSVTLVLYREGEPEPMAELPFPESLRGGSGPPLSRVGQDGEPQV
jgi:glycogen operon protein